MSITKNYFGKTSEGSDAYLYKLTNSNGCYCSITNFGGIIVSIFVPDRHGNLEDITLGYDHLDGYLKKGPYFGAIIGRHANRIENSKFELNGVEYKLAANDGSNHLHGGSIGFDKVLWDAEIIQNDDVEELRLTYLSKDGEENYPGNLQVKVIYSFNDENELKIEYFAVSDKDTLVNLTNHAYFNLSGHSSGSIYKHKMMINADKYTKVNGEGIPTGEISEVKDTVMDFTTIGEIGPRFDSKEEQMVLGGGFDHNWVLNQSGLLSEMAAEVYDPKSGRIMEVYTNKPGIQFYTGNFLDGSEIGKAGATYGKRSGLCLETQLFPNAMAHKHFPSPILKAGDEYRYTTVYKFLV